MKTPNNKRTPTRGNAGLAPGAVVSSTQQGKFTTMRGVGQPGAVEYNIFTDSVLVEIESQRPADPLNIGEPFSSKASRGPVACDYCGRTALAGGDGYYALFPGPGERCDVHIQYLDFCLVCAVELHSDSHEGENHRDLLRARALIATTAERERAIRERLEFMRSTPVDGRTT
jgi:hypothetical protein